MIKYFLIFISVTLTSFSLDQTYLLQVTNSLQEYKSNEVTLETTKNEVDLKEETTDSSDKFATTINKKISTPKDITIFKEKQIKPINYTNTISLNKLQVSDKKQKFFHMILPAILVSKQKLKVKRARVKSIIGTVNPTSEDIVFLEGLYKTYKTTNNKELLSRMQTHPVSIILAQAAIESAWGESRFFKEGKNIFGMWSYNKNEPRMKALGTRDGKAIFVRKYATLSDAIDHYFVTIGRGAYKSFRKQRDITDNPLQLVQYLVNYCELREKYTKKLQKFIIANKLENFDDFQIDKMYLTANF